MRAWSLTVLVLLCSPLVHAGGAEDVDREIARHHYEEGLRFYQANDYQGALKEFLLARQVMQAGALDFNIARCQDRLEQLSDAIASYQRYVDSTPTPADATEVRQRIGVLKARLEAQSTAATRLSSQTEAPPTPAKATRKRRYWIAGVVIGSLAAVGLGVGLGVGLSSGAPPSPSLGMIGLMTK
jgi:tetratricopeptide (TPR) repeat protein